MCLRSILPKNQQDNIINEIDESGLKVYKVVRNSWIRKYRPAFTNKDIDYEEGINEAIQIEIKVSQAPFRHIQPDMPFRYMSGFHFYKSKIAAKRICDFLNRGYKLNQSFRNLKEQVYKVIECKVQKDWITAIGQEWGDKGKLKKTKLETVIVAKKAIFPKFRGKLKT